MTVKKRYIFLILFIAITQVVNANSYYFSSTDGNDSNTAAQAQNPSTPWKSIAKLNSFFLNIQPGDLILFKRGDEFYGTINITVSGSAASPIILDAYGTGNNPVITGFTQLNSWQAAGAGIWKSNLPAGSAAINMVILNNTEQAIGRYPNSGYLTYQSHSGNSSITDSKSASPFNWTGAELVIRKNHYIIDRATITSQSGGTFQYAGSSYYTPTDMFGYFIQNDPKTLDQPGEWYFDNANKQMLMYFNSDPGTSVVKASTTDNLISINNRNYININHLDLQGANVAAFQIVSANHIAIQYCNVNFSGQNGVNMIVSNFVSITNTTFNNSNNSAIYVPNSNNHDVTISDVSIKNTGILVGMGEKQDEQTERNAIYIIGPNNTVQRCSIDNTAYIPIWPKGDNLLVKNNYITNFCFVKDDGGGIWTWNNPAAPVTYSGQKIIDNIILNGIGALEGSVKDEGLGASGIYCDNNSANFEITGNTIANCLTWGILIHDAHDISISNNTIYNTGNSQVSLDDDDNTRYNKNVVSPIRNIKLNNNILFSKQGGQLSVYFASTKSDIGQFGAVDNNYYGKPQTFTNSFLTFHMGTDPWPGNTHSFANWKPMYGFDNNSTERLTASTDKVLFFYNETSADKDLPLDQVYTDLRNVSYTGKITLKPFSSAILIGKNIICDLPKPVIAWW